MAAKRQKKKKKNIIGILFVAVILVWLGATGFSWWRDYSPHPVDSATISAVTIKQGATTAQIAQTLKENNIIKKPFFFRLVSKFGGHDGTYQQGEFELKTGMGYEEIFKALKGIGKNPNSVKITIPEGYELRQIADKLEEAGLINKTVFFDLIENEPFDYDFVRALPKRENRLEGYLFPDTYQFEKTDSEKTIINAMLKRFDEVYSEKYKARAKELNMTTDQIVTLASIIEREAVGDTDRKDVSSVFHNRLKSQDMPYLQSCATVQYILKERKTVLSEADTKIQSPYNTYINKGLPVGPIASPGEKSIEAALYPNHTDYLFFVLDSSGTHRFSKTYEEHLANMKK